MIHLNFAHLFTASLLKTTEALTDGGEERIFDRPPQFASAQPFVPQGAALGGRVGLLSVEWPTRPLVVNFSAFNIIAVTLLPGLHSRIRYFPAAIRLRPVSGSKRSQFEGGRYSNSGRKSGEMEDSRGLFLNPDINRSMNVFFF